MKRTHSTRNRSIGLTTPTQVISNIQVQPHHRGDIYRSDSEPGSVNVVEMRSFSDTDYFGKMAGSGVALSQSELEEQVSKIKFGKGVTDISGLNKYSDAKSSSINLEEPNPSGRGSHNPKGDKLPGEVLKRKLLMKMLRERTIKSAQKGQGLVIHGTSSGQSRSKDLSKGYKLKSGGFVFTLAAIFGAITAAVTSTAGTAILSAGATAAATAVVNKIFGDGGDKEMLLKEVNKTKLKFSELPKDLQLIIKKQYDKIKDNPTIEGIKKLADKVSGPIKKAFGDKLKNKLGVNPMGSGRVPFGGMSDEKFKKTFADNLVKELV